MSGTEYTSKKNTPLKAIRKKCLECCGGSYYFVRTCPAATCALHPFRMGKNPYLKKKAPLSPSEKAEVAAWLKAGQEKAAAARASEAGADQGAPLAEPGDHAMIV